MITDKKIIRLQKKVTPGGKVTFELQLNRLWFVTIEEFDNEQDANAAFENAKQSLINNRSIFQTTILNEFHLPPIIDNPVI